VFILALAASEADNATLSRRVTAGVFSGLVLLATEGGWYLAYRNRRPLEVGRDAIVSRRRSAQPPRPGRRTPQPVTFGRAEGDTLRAFAACAASPDEAQAGLAEAARIEGKGAAA
jgi:hypothetical protein